MRVGYSVTFEFQTLKPLTHRGTVEASSPGTCFARAVRQAQKALRPVAWASVVCVLDRGEAFTPREAEVNRPRADSHGSQSCGVAE